MAKINLNGCEYHYEVHGTGAETIVFSHGLLFSGHMFHKQVDYFKQNYRVVLFDHRGQGQSEVTQDGYDIDSLTRDVTKLIEFLDVGQVHFVGLSMGGFVGMRLAARRPDLIKSLILMNTSAETEPNGLKYKFLCTVVKLLGVNIVTTPVMKIMFGQKFINDPKRKEEYQHWVEQLQSNAKTITRAAEGVINRKGVEAELQNIECPTLILACTQDIATIPQKSEFIHARIPHSTIKFIEGAGHSSSVEEPEQVNQSIERFLDQFKQQE
jgi:3-oxoadipate enol-lactonase